MKKFPKKTELYLSSLLLLSGSLSVSAAEQVQDAQEPNLLVKHLKKMIMDDAWRIPEFEEAAQALPTLNEKQLASVRRTRRYCAELFTHIRNVVDDQSVHTVQESFNTLLTETLALSGVVVDKAKVKQYLKTEKAKIKAGTFERENTHAKLLEFLQYVERPELTTYALPIADKIQGMVLEHRIIYCEQESTRLYLLNDIIERACHAEYRDMNKLRHIVHYGSLEDFKQHESLLSPLSYNEIGAIHAEREYWEYAQAIVQEMLTTPGLQDCFDVMRCEAKQGVAVGKCSKLHTYITLAQQKMKEDKEAGIAIDPVRERALDLLHFSTYHVNVWPCVVAIKAHFAQVDPAEKELLIKKDGERLAIIGPIIERECMLWVTDMVGLTEYGDVWTTSRKLKPGEKYVAPRWPTVDDEPGYQSSSQQIPEA